MLLEHMIRESLHLPGVTLSEASFCRTLHYDAPDGSGTGTTAFYPLFRGVVLAYTEVQTPSWPMPELSAELAEHRLLVLGYCVAGRSKLQTADGAMVYMNSGEISVTQGYAVREYVYAQKMYKGIELLIDLDDLGKEKEYLRRDFGVDFALLEKRYCPGGKPYIGPCVTEWKALMRKMWSLSEAHTLYAVQRMRMYMMVGVGMLLNSMNTPGARQGSFLTEGQIQMARETKELLCKDLSRNYTMAELAQQFAVSESSLKSYFRGVYGKSVTVYLHDLRMETGAVLLECSNATVAEIATRMGYVRQSKFAEAFKNRYGVTPLEYRRMKAGMQKAETK